MDSTDTLTTVMRVVGFTEIAVAFSQASQLVDQFAKMQAVAAEQAAVLAAAQQASHAAQQALSIASQDYIAILNQYGAGSLAAASASTELALAQDVAADAAANLAVAEAAALLPLLPLILAITAIVIAIGAASAAVHTFSEESRQLFRVQALLHNLGDSVPIDKFEMMAQTIRKATGFAKPEIEDVSAKLLAAGIHGDQLQKVLMGAADAARTSGTSLSEIGDIIARGDLGKARGLVGLGILGHDTGSIQGNQAQILEQIEKRSKAAAAAFNNTLPGALDQFSASLQNMLSKLGEQFAPELIKILHALTAAMDFVADHARQIVNFIKLTASGNIVGAIIEVVRDALHKDKGPSAGFGQGQLATEATARQIADNTKQMPDLIRGIIGGTGAFKQEFATGAVMHAMAI